MRTIGRVISVVTMGFFMAITLPRHDCLAGTLKGITMPDAVTVAGKTLVLNGMGIRQATILKVKVYVMGLYLEQKSSDADAIVNSPQTKRLVVHYIRELKQADVLKALKESFTANNTTLDNVKAEYEKFLGYVSDMKKDDEMVLDFVENRVDIQVAGQKKEPITSDAFQKTLLRVWLGPKPTYPPLQAGILGK